MIITATGTVAVQAINAWRSPKKQDIIDLQGITQIIRQKADHAIKQNDELKTQTNSHYTELEKKLNNTEEENKLLRERLIALAHLVPAQPINEHTEAQADNANINPSK